MDTIRVMIVEDDPDWLRGLRAYLNRQPDIEVAAAVSTSEEALRAIQQSPIDVVMMDIMLADSAAGIVLTSEIVDSTNARVIMLTSMEDKELVFEAFQAGAIDYLVKHSFEQIPAAIRSAYRNQSPISAAAAEKMRSEFRRLKQLEREIETERIRNLVTPAELEVLRMIDQGYSQPQIAEELVVSLRTIKVHVGNILKKLGSPSSKEAAQRLRELGAFSSNEDQT
ncbi:DNA-binding response regulator [Xylanibacillus composti]|uniref:DNA-binding response regulator n=1 Tax=Xylanibacillus composti TaxID=1572762 RepID=A0A8J4H7J5_9BACL|nr:response regulator transcription factor [Xylanibacillus composti]MDT9727052.1 DNA-binding response regulator [Xylanibacillus composti]GIQ71191.1 DNA-binding response regulator [Xylanibacillus composti]